jgi:hypothetical protein
MDSASISQGDDKNPPVSEQERKYLNSPSPAVPQPSNAAMQETPQSALPACLSAQTGGMYQGVAE